MRGSKHFFYTLLSLDFLSALLAFSGMFLITEQTIIQFGDYLRYYWIQIYTFLIGYPLQVLILITLTAALSYVLQLFGYKIR